MPRERSILTVSQASMENLDVARINRWAPVVRRMDHHHHSETMCFDVYNTSCSVRLNICTCNRDVHHEMPVRLSSSCSRGNRAPRADGSSHLRRNKNWDDNNPTMPRRGRRNGSSSSSSSVRPKSRSLHTRSSVDHLGASTHNVPRSRSLHSRTTTDDLRGSSVLDSNSRSRVSSKSRKIAKSSMKGTKMTRSACKASPSRSSWPSSQSDDISEAIALALATISEEESDEFSNNSNHRSPTAIATTTNKIPTLLVPNSVAAQVA